jgi:hypothetical protein
MEQVPYESVFGSLMYAMVCARPDISHAVGVFIRYMSTPRNEHWTTVKRVFRYLCGTKDYAICYQGKPRGDSGKLNIHGFFNIDWVGDLDRRRSTNTYVFKMFHVEISWMSKRHAVVSFSMTEYEYMEATHGRKIVVCLQRLFSGIKFE